MPLGQVTAFPRPGVSPVRVGWEPEGRVRKKVRQRLLLCAGFLRILLFPKQTLDMAKSRIIAEKLLFPGESVGQRDRHMRFFILAILLGVSICVGVGLILYKLNMQGRF
jgi:hypothetical protein